VWTARLSIVMGVPIANDIFGRRGYGGDVWAVGNAHVSLMGVG
jgi:1,2-phenylacetyl-CoA epoxidase PaaB subunit